MQKEQQEISFFLTSCVQGGGILISNTFDLLPTITAPLKITPA